MPPTKLTPRSKQPRVSSSVMSSPSIGGNESALASGPDAACSAATGGDGEVPAPAASDVRCIISIGDGSLHGEWRWEHASSEKPNINVMRRT